MTSAKDQTFLLSVIVFLALGVRSPAVWGQEGSSDGTGTITGTLRVTAPARGEESEPAGDDYNPFSSSAYSWASAHKAHANLPEEIVVYLEAVKGYWKPPEEHAKLDQKYTQFTHRVLPILAGTIVDFTNHDPIYHNVFSNSRKNAFDLGKRKKGETASAKLDHPEVPVKVFCEIHDKMRSNILILQNPFFTVVTPGGTFKLESVPCGTYTLVAWHDFWQPVRKKITVTKNATVVADVVLDKVQD
jgi:plastocyanin